MEIIFYHPVYNSQEWVTAICQQLPQANVRVWKEGDTALADYALVWKPPYAMLNGRYHLKGIFVLGAGVETILEQERQFPGSIPENVPIIRLEDAGMAQQMEEYTVAAVMRYFRRFDEYQKLQWQKNWQFLPPYTYDSFQIGIMGMGVLGRAVAARLVSLGFSVKSWSRAIKQIDGVKSYSQDQLSDFLTDTKLLINLLPDTPETVGILNQKLFSQLAKKAYLINLSRGSHLVDHELLSALQNQQIRAATLDVFKQEPLPTHHPFWQHPNITVTPHIAAVTRYEEAVIQICQKIEILEQGGQVTGRVDLERGY